MSASVLWWGLMVVGMGNAEAWGEAEALWKQAEPQLWWTVGSELEGTLELQLSMSRRREIRARYHVGAQRMFTEGPSETLRLEVGYIQANLKRGAWVLGSYHMFLGEGLTLGTGRVDGLDGSSTLQAQVPMGRLRQGRELLGAAGHGWVMAGSISVHGWAFGSRRWRDMYQGFLRSPCGSGCKTTIIYSNEDIETSYRYESYGRILREDVVGAATAVEGDSWRLGLSSYLGTGQVREQSLELTEIAPYPSHGTFGALGVFGSIDESSVAVRGEWARSHGGGQSLRARAEWNLENVRMRGSARWRQEGFRHPLGAGRQSREVLEGKIQWLLRTGVRWRLRIEGGARRRLHETGTGRLPLLGASAGVTWIHRWARGLSTILGSTYRDADLRVTGREESYAQGAPPTRGSLEACYLSPDCGPGLGRGERWELRGAARWHGRRARGALDYRFRAEDVVALSRFARSHTVRFRGAVQLGWGLFLAGNIRFTRAEQALTFRRPPVRVAARLGRAGERISSSLRCGGDTGLGGADLFCDLRIQVRWQSEAR